MVSVTGRVVSDSDSDIYEQSASTSEQESEIQIEGLVQNLGKIDDHILGGEKLSEPHKTQKEEFNPSFENLDEALLGDKEE